MKSALKKVGPLDTVEVISRQKGPCIVLFHGYGADCYDLTPLCQETPGPNNLSWYFPNGPIEVPVGPMLSGRAWFNIDIQALEEAMRMGRYRDFSKKTPPGLDKAKILAYEFLKELKRPFSEIIIGGFSQGAMLATELAISSMERFRAVVILSGSIIKEDEWVRLAPQHEGMPFFQSHGDTDALLDPEAAIRLEKLLSQAGWVGQTEYFRGGHEIPRTVLKQLGYFLKNVVS